MSSRIAMCACGEPLVATFAFRGYEFFCMTCGRKYTYFGPQGQDATPELIARSDAAEAALRAIEKDTIPGGMYRLGSCDACKAEPHLTHATPEELVASEAAYGKLAAIRERAAR